VVLEVNAIEAVNSLLADLAASGVSYRGQYKPIRMHAITNAAFLEQLGFVSKSSTSWSLLSALQDAGYKAADAWVAAHLGKVGERSSVDVKAELTHRVMQAPLPGGRDG
jgi:NTE family protein